MTPQTITPAALEGIVIPAPKKTGVPGFEIENGHAPTVSRHFGNRAVGALTSLGVFITHGDNLNDGRGFCFFGKHGDRDVAYTDDQIRSLLDGYPVAPTFTMRLRDLILQADTLAELSEMYAAARIESGEGFSTFPWGVARRGETGFVVAVLSYNAKAWPFDGTGFDFSHGKGLDDAAILSHHHDLDLRGAKSEPLFNPYSA